MKISETIGIYNILNVVAYFAYCAGTFIAGTTYFFNIPNFNDAFTKYPSIVTPPKWCMYSIWAVIFLSQLIFTVVQLLCYATNDLVIKGVSFKYIFVCLSQVGWSFALAYEIMWLSMGFMVASLAFLIAILRSQYALKDKGRTKYLLLQFPFVVHTGWVISATIINANILLVYYNESLEGQYYSALASQGLILVISCVVLFQQQRLARAFPDLVIPAVLIVVLVATCLELLVPNEVVQEAFPEHEILRVQVAAGVVALIIFVSGAAVGLQALCLRLSIDPEEEARYLRADDDDNVDTKVEN